MIAIKELLLIFGKTIWKNVSSFDKLSAIRSEFSIKSSVPGLKTLRICKGLNRDIPLEFRWIIFAFNFCPIFQYSFCGSKTITEFPREILITN
ncbi:hypothetical protein [Mesomycoplasma hyopneumoniae]|uniref:hypothetical protein n=1 Tax=Mesomycoplasma hyopneumoniae TaxID=2099 RepID=UPI001E6479FC|nr:hypothetical protein [Mesomycoplasma hyopneumoniae]